MKISLATRMNNIDNIHGINGYGTATIGMMGSLQRLGYHTSINDSSADVQIAFDQPQNWNFQDGPYTIGYHPWESTQLLPGWAEIMNKCDEIWTPSPLIAHWYKKYAGITVPVYVYEHGLDPAWKPVKRVPTEKIKFLHVGAEATRKGGWEAVRAFRRAFPDRDDVSLTIKMINSDWVQISSLGKVRYINETYTKDELRYLFYTHDAYVYPSAGEGFGLTPLQAIGTGMPTIVPHAWAPYEQFLDPRLDLGTTLVTSSWPKIHPGKVFRVDFDDIIDRFRFVADNYDSVRDFACSNALEVHERYNWDRLTKQTFELLEERLDFKKGMESGTPVEIIGSPKVILV